MPASKIVGLRRRTCIAADGAQGSLNIVYEKREGGGWKTEVIGLITIKRFIMIS